MGANAPWLHVVRNKASELPCMADVLVNVQDMAQLMVRSDLAIGAAGGTAWERCCMGLPSCIFVLADNQNAGAYALHKAQAAHLMRSVAEVVPFIRNLLQNDAKCGLEKMSKAAAQITDGKGVVRLRNYLVGHDYG
jgi:spore coat polysaccharide biosynthesis predicted glycosyltransferase SpsG